MRSGWHWAVAAFVLCACGAETPDGAGVLAGSGGTGIALGGGVSGMSGGAAGARAGNGAAPSGGASGTSATSAGAGGTIAASGTGGGSAAAGAGNGAGGAAAGAGGAIAGGAGGAPAGPPTPRIPEPKGECPNFNSGSAMVGLLRLQIDSGVPKETKGSLLFAWHFTAGTAGAAMAGVPASVRSEITDGGGIVVAPQGNVGGSGRTDIAPPTGAWFVQDLEVADQIVACAVKNHNIDPNRIYSTGCSAGGLMSGTFGLMRSEYVAAVAPNSGGINYMNSRMLSDKTHAPAAFLMHGGTGDNVIVNFGDTSHWFEDQNKLAANKPFMIECNHGLGHCGAPSSLHVQAWEFMKAHPYDVGTSPWASSPPSGLPSYCKVVPAE